MYLFESCPFKVISKSGELTCFDTGTLECVRPHPETARNFCQWDFRQCPYYLTQGKEDRFRGERVRPQKRLGPQESLRPRL